MAEPYKRNVKAAFDIVASGSVIKAYDLPANRAKGYLVFLIKTDRISGMPTLKIEYRPIVMALSNDSEDGKTLNGNKYIIPFGWDGSSSAVIGYETAQVYNNSDNPVNFDAVVTTDAEYYYAMVKFDDVPWDGIELKFTESAGGEGSITLAMIVD